MRQHYVTFAVGEVRYCLPVERVQQIVRRENLISIPKPPPFVEGVINLRGEIVPVFDLGSRIAEPGGARGARGRSGGAEYRRRVVVARMGNRLCGLDVEEVREIIDVDAAAVKPATGPDADNGIVEGVVTTEGGALLLLGLRAVLDTALGDGAPEDG